MDETTAAVEAGSHKKASFREEAGFRLFGSSLLAAEHESHV